MLFHEKSRKAINIGFMVVGVLVIISMVLFYFPVWQY